MLRYVCSVRVTCCWRRPSSQEACAVSNVAAVSVERPRAKVAVAVLTGEHDLMTADRLRALLRTLVEENDLVVVDVSEAEFVDSTTMTALIVSNELAVERGRRFRLQLGTAPIVRRAIELGGLLEMLKWAATREEVLRD